MIFSLLLLAVVVLIVRAMKSKKEVLNHWNILIHNLGYSSQEFYKKLNTELDSQKISGLKFKTSEKKTSSILSHKRLYATITYDGYVYDVCAAPFGESFFVSYWMQGTLNPMENFVSRIPFLGKRLVKLFFPVTFYRIDTSNMFHSLMHETIIELVNTISQENELETLTDQQTTPKMKNLFER